MHRLAYNTSNHLGNVMATVSDRKLGIWAEDYSMDYENTFDNGAGGWVSYESASIGEGEGHLLIEVDAQGSGAEYALDLSEACLYEICITYLDEEALVGGDLQVFDASDLNNPVVDGSFINGQKCFTFDATNFHSIVIRITAPERGSLRIDDLTVEAQCEHFTHYAAQVESSQDYYPFGSVMPGRNYTARGYRYGFQGQETDDELKGDGNSVNFKYRLHDPRIGRFFAVDPLAAKYSYNSPYAFSENRVVDAIELEGLERLSVTYLWTDNGYKRVLYNNAGYGSGSLMRWVGGPLVPEGYDERQLWINGDKQYLDRVQKSISRVWEETKFVVELEVKSAVTVETKGKAGPFSGRGEVSQVFQTTTMTASKTGLEVEATGPETTVRAEGGITGLPSLSIEGSTSGAHSVGFTYGPITWDQYVDQQGEYGESLLLSVPLGSKSGAGVKNEFTLKVGFKFEGERNRSTEEVMKESSGNN